MSKYLYLLTKNQFKVMFYITVVIILYKALTPSGNDFLFEFPHADKVLHFLAFFTLSFLLNRSSGNITKRARNMLSLLAFGVFLEVLQSFTGYREVSLADVIADLLGILFFQFTYSLLKKWQVRRQKK